MSWQQAAAEPPAYPAFRGALLLTSAAKISAQTFDSVCSTYTMHTVYLCVAKIMKREWKVWNQNLYVDF